MKKIYNAPVIEIYTFPTRNLFLVTSGDKNNVVTDKNIEDEYDGVDSKAFSGALWDDDTQE